VVTLTAALCGFLLQQNAFEKILSSKLQSMLRDRSALLTATVTQRIQSALTPDRVARLGAAGREILLEPASATAGAHRCGHVCRETRG
jgi:hypothetical protein